MLRGPCVAPRLLFVVNTRRLAAASQISNSVKFTNAGGEISLIVDLAPPEDCAAMQQLQRQCTLADAASTADGASTNAEVAAAEDEQPGGGSKALSSQKAAARSARLRPLSRLFSRGAAALSSALLRSRRLLDSAGAAVGPGSDSVPGDSDLTEPLTPRRKVRSSVRVAPGVLPPRASGSFLCPSELTVAPVLRPRLRLSPPPTLHQERSVSSALDEVIACDGYTTPRANGGGPIPATPIAGEPPATPSTGDGRRQQQTQDEGPVIRFRVIDDGVGVTPGAQWVFRPRMIIV